MNKDCGKGYCLTCQEVFPVAPEKQICMDWQVCYHAQLMRLAAFASKPRDGDKVVEAQYDG